MRAAGAVRCELSMATITSAMLRAGRLSVPAKMTSSIRRRAHAFIGRLAHHPAQRFEKIGFSAAVRANDAGKTGADQKLSRLHKGFEAKKPQPCDLQKCPPFRSTARVKLAIDRPRMRVMLISSPADQQ